MVDAFILITMLAVFLAALLAVHALFHLVRGLLRIVFKPKRRY